MAPPLQQRPAFPSDQAYVVRLHHLATPRGGQLCGRVEHIASGNYADFENTAQLAQTLIDLALGCARGDFTTRRQQDPNKTVP